MGFITFKEVVDNIFIYKEVITLFKDAPHCINNVGIDLEGRYNTNTACTLPQSCDFLHLQSLKNGVVVILIFVYRSQDLTFFIFYC